MKTQQRLKWRFNQYFDVLSRFYQIQFPLKQIYCLTNQAVNRDET
jgi:hypothetical protein